MKFLRKVLFRFLLPTGCLGFLFLPHNVYGMNSLPLQQLTLGSQWSPSRSALDPSKGLLYFMQEQTLTVVDLEAFRILGQFEQSAPGPGMSFNDYQPVVMQSVLYLVKDRGGSLLKWENGSWIRLDNDSENKMQAGSTVFAREGRIYRYGDTVSGVAGIFLPATIRLSVIGKYWRRSTVMNCRRGLRVQI
jgi:hypothetical protein